MRRMIPVSDFLHTPESSTFPSFQSVRYEPARPTMSEEAAIVLENDKRRIEEHLQRARLRRKKRVA